MANLQHYDFAGYATKNDLLCSDGRTIRKNAFKDCDGAVVPLVWNHGGRTDPTEILGHALLENRDDGVYMYGTFNDTEKAKVAKACVNHGDITGLSIYANSLKQKAGDVLHGVIREVSLVLAGANPGATIDFVMQHDSESLDSFYYYLNGDDCEFKHSDIDDEEDLDEEPEKDPEEEEKDMSFDDEMDYFEHADDESIEEVLNSLNDKQKAAVVVLIESMLKDEGGEVKHADSEDAGDGDDDATVEDILNSLNDKQKAAVAMMIEGLAEDDDDEKDEDNDMKHNAFEENTATYGNIDGLMSAAIKDIKQYGSLKESVLKHADEFGYGEDALYGDSLAHAYPRNEANQEITYGTADIEYLFPDAQMIENTPKFIRRKDDWVEKFLNATHKTPFANVKSIFADITADEARAKGYVKGNRKIEEVFTLLKRKTTPQTIYKKQKLDRDDILDITSFDVVAWMKGELRIMLNEELARACLIGDGRSNASADKISELNVRPIYTDDSLFVIKVPVVVPSDHTDDDDAKALIKASIRARKDYKGTGNPTMFTTADMLTSMLLLEDGIGRPLYPTQSELASRVRVKEIVEVAVMENQTRTEGNKTLNLAAIIVNPVDYNIGAVNAGKTSFFEDFDIDYNQEKYLLETRCSGALVNPYSAIVLELDPSGPAAHGA